MTDDEVRALLRTLDEPGTWEHPSEFSFAGTRAALSALGYQLNARFSTTCRVEEAQDASLCGRVEIPVEALQGLDRLVVSISNFGSLAVISAENPGAYLDLEEAAGVYAADLADLEGVREVLAGCGYVEIPEELLTVDYDGPGGFVPRYGDRRASWWLRYFDYL
jgi:hypothetical protein